MIDPQYLYRLSRWLYLRGVPKLPSIIQRLNYGITGCDLPPTAQVGKRVRFPHHGAGVMIHTLTIIGDDVYIMPQVVLGQNIRDGVAVPMQNIVIRNGVVLGAGAKVICSGYLEIGEKATVGANAVVLKSVPAGAVVAGVPARIITPRRDQQA